MVAGERRHHRAAAGARAHDGAAHRIPHIHEGDRARRIGADAEHRRPFRPQAGKVVTDAAALLHGQRRFAQMGEDAVERIRDRAHHKTVEQGDIAAGAGARQNPPCRQKAVTGQRTGEDARPFGAFLRYFGFGQRNGDAGPAFRHVMLTRGAAGLLQPVFQVPDLVGNITHCAFAGLCPVLAFVPQEIRTPSPLFPRSRFPGGGSPEDGVRGRQSQ